MINQRIKKNYFKYLRPKINQENKKRNQFISIIMDQANPFSYFNYFSIDLIKLTVILKYFIKKSTIKNIHNFNLDVVKLFVKSSPNSEDIDKLLNKSVYNNFTIFKNPVVSMDIFLYTCLSNEKNINVNKLNLEFLRYKLLQKIYEDNISFRKINSNIQFFLVLLKTQLSDFQLNRCYEDKIIIVIVYIFRNTIMNDVDLLQFIMKNTKKIRTSIFLTNRRAY